jgi:hypothetical protein
MAKAKTISIRSCRIPKDNTKPGRVPSLDQEPSSHPSRLTSMKLALWLVVLGLILAVLGSAWARSAWRQGQ